MARRGTPRKAPAKRRRSSGGASPRRRAPAQRAASLRPSPRAESSRLEHVAEAFEEALQHLKTEGATDLSLGPVVPVPMLDLAAGVVGWKVELATDDTGTGGPRRGTLYLLAVPEGSDRIGKDPEPTPLRDLRWGDVHALRVPSGFGHLLLLSHPRDPPGEPWLRTLAEEARQAFRPDLD